MFVSRKKFNALVKRVDELESKVATHTFYFGDTDLAGLCRRLPDFVDDRIDKKIAVGNSQPPKKD